MGCSGLEHGGLIPPALKEKVRSIEKVQIQFKGDASRITDLARTTISFGSMEKLHEALGIIKSKTKIVLLKDRFEKPLDGYRDILMELEMSNGDVVEMQLHLASILGAKNRKGHEIYKTMRDIRARAKTEGRRLTLSEISELEQLATESESLYTNALEKGGKE